MITYSSDTNDLTFKDLRDTAKLAEKYFGTEKDPSQMPTNEKESKWIFNNLSECVNTIKYNGELIGFSFILPCNKELMDDFLSKKINEAQLYKEIKKKITYKNFTTIYLCSAFVKPEYRRKGLASKAIKKSIKKLIKNKKLPPLFFESYSEEGRKTVEVMAKKLKIQIKERV